MPLAYCFLTRRAFTLSPVLVLVGPYEVQDGFVAVERPASRSWSRRFSFSRREFEEKVDALKTDEAKASEMEHAICAFYLFIRAPRT